MYAIIVVVVATTAESEADVAGISSNLVRIVAVGALGVGFALIAIVLALRGKRHVARVG